MENMKMMQVQCSISASFVLKE